MYDPHYNPAPPGRRNGESVHSQKETQSERLTNAYSVLLETKIQQRPKFKEVPAVAEKNNQTEKNKKTEANVIKNYEDSDSDRLKQLVVSFVAIAGEI